MGGGGEKPTRAGFRPRGERLQPNRARAVPEPRPPPRSPGAWSCPSVCAGAAPRSPALSCRAAASLGPALQARFPAPGKPAPGPVSDSLHAHPLLFPGSPSPPVRTLPAVRAGPPGVSGRPLRTSSSVLMCGPACDQNCQARSDLRFLPLCVSVL